MDLRMTKEQVAEKLVAIHKWRCHKARTSFYHFVDYIWDCKYQWNWHHKILAEKLEQFYNGEIDRMMVFMPPRFGKSELVSKLFPAWYFGRNPNESILGTSYSAELASIVNRDIQRIIMSDAYSDIFPDTRLSTSGIKGMRDAKRTNTSFEIVDKGGFYHSAGVSGAITGMGFNCIIVDDPVKNHQEAESKTFRNRTHRWYSSDVYSRLEKNGRILIVQTRWHEDDLAGRIIENAIEDWEVVSFPAIKTDNQNKDDPRKIGHALWPDKYNIKTLETIKEQQGSRYFASLYQQTPTAQEGNIFKRGWFKRYTDVDLSNAIVNFTIDTAYTKDVENDATAIMAYCKVGGIMYVIHCIQVRLEFPDLVKFIKQYVRDHGYTHASRIYVEPKASGLSVVQQLKVETGLNIIKDKAPKDSKETRAHSITAKIEAGKVLFPSYGSWVDELIDECCGFPGMKHDDRLDTLMMAIRLSFRQSALRMRGRSA